MKRLFAIILLAILVAAVGVPALAYAEEGTYLEIDRDGVYLYDNTLVTPPLFVIPRTYYVKVVDPNYASGFWIVEYNGVRGLIKISDVSGKTTTDVESPYYTATTVSAYPDTFLYEKPNFESKTQVKAYGLNLLYLGKTKGEQHNYGTDTWFAVSYTDHVYFIHSAMTANLNLLESSFAPVHPNSVKEASATPSESEETSTEKAPSDGFDLVRLLLIIGMIVPIVIVLFLLFRPGRRSDRLRQRDERERPERGRRSPRERYYRDEEDYYDD